MTHEFRFRCNGYRSVLAYSSREAAEIFANRAAKRIYGSRGYCHHVRNDCHSPDNRNNIYEAYIGVPVRGGGCSGTNIWLAVHS